MFDSSRLFSTNTLRKTRLIKPVIFWKTWFSAMLFVSTHRQTFGGRGRMCEFLFSCDHNLNIVSCYWLVLAKVICCVFLSSFSSYQTRFDTSETSSCSVFVMSSTMNFLKANQTMIQKLKSSLNMYISLLLWLVPKKDINVGGALTIISLNKIKSETVWKVNVIWCQFNLV